MITDLMRASMENDPAKVLACLADGDDIDAADEGGRTALMWAAVCASDAAIFVLLQQGANQALRDYEGDTAWDLARQSDSDMLYLDALMRLGLSVARAH